MRDTEKIEKQLFKDEPVFLKEVEGNKGQKEIKQWAMNKYKNPDEVEVEMEKAKKNNTDDSEIWIRIIVVVLVIISPLIIIYNLTETLCFRCCPRKRKDEYRNMMQKRAAEAKRIRPDRFDFDFFRNRDKVILYFSSSQAMYPSCEVSLYVPEEKADGYHKVPWQDKRKLYSFRAPNIFHSYWAEGYVSDLVEHGWLRKFQQDYRLTDAVPVINYSLKNSDDVIWYNRKISNWICTELWGEEEKAPVECFVELLSTVEPVKDTDWELVEYRWCPLGTFTLERGCFDRLTNRSRRRLDRILEEYRINI
jgi:hypothetical protein